MQFERNALNHTTNIINSQPPTTTIPSFHSTANIDALKYNLFHHNLNSDNYVKSTSTESSSDEGNSPTELNNCRKLLEKPPLVKRLTMGILRTQEDSRPLVHNKSSSITSSDSIQTISDGYVNEAICDSDKIVSNKYSDSFRQAFNHHTFQMQPLSSSISNAIPLNTLNLKKNVITTSVQVHNASDKSTNLSYNYNETNFCDFDYKKNFSNNSETAPSSPTSSDKRTIVPPILPLRNDALSIPEQNDLKNCSWFQAGLPREISLEILTRQNPGAFLVRQSESKMGCFALSLRVPPPAPAKVAHYLILRTQRGGYKIKGFTKEFSSLRALITHHSVMKELLPIPLNLPRQYEIQQHQRHDLDDLDNLWYIK
ncbi:hypothetical protein PVAND_007660 [Polypedilum vanderplanki]|uniref:SH2 domain-containing protein n=1 Tax=Polypedilum vanderplanki TaxID=319348 RepID=A0A9J6C819_POLVA|nr:hypothetical protein PVAND_007660 [Polypedilum vanderplanki]